ncbi:phospholipase D-like protein [Roseivirga pacifica]|uniref:PLD nuclease N-terminal domain-containing protein n=1 Tax=Roseivirga pacifica TaxID=1267423 RepID=UPI000F1B2512|nr:phospholipase D-like protein [Roseivirga pacifica]
MLVTIIALIDILKSEFHPEQNKIIWVIVVLVAPLIGSILYFFIGRDQKRKSQATN